MSRLTLLAASLALTVILSACSFGKPAPDSNTPSASADGEVIGEPILFATEVPTATKDNCPVHPDVCALAAEVDEPLRVFQENLAEPGSPDTLSDGDISGIISILRPVDIECTYSGPMIYDLCEGVRSDQKRLGIWVWNDSYGNDRGAWTITRVERELLFRSPRPDEVADELGEPYLRLVAIGCPASLGGLANCRDNFSFVFSSKAKYPHDDASRRYVMILPVSWPQDTAPAARLIIPYPTSNRPTSELAPFILGGVVSGEAAIFTREPSWLSGQPDATTGVFVPWRP
ncbi:MAG: hypothetical protein GEU75_12545 [Dehalococcoidia bacterium]|nr:hypothetical protein [Dehalococcoidia bacterium]